MFMKSLVASALVIALTGMSTAALALDPVIFSFSTVGDTRQDPSAAKVDPTAKINGQVLPQDANWLQNSKAWARILRTVQSQKSNLLFVNGDMIMGYGRAIVPANWGAITPALTDVLGSDLVQFYKQYAYWRGMTANSMETGTYVIPVPGNHEVQCSDAVSKLNATSDANKCATGKNAYVENENAWRANMSDLIGDLSSNLRFSTVTGVAAQNVSGLTAATAPSAVSDPSFTNAAGVVENGISTDQSQLTFSFDIPTSNNMLLHFVVVNTDAVGWDSHVPNGWLASDFAAAKARADLAGKTAKYFVFGHKPAFTYNYQASGALAAGGLDASTVTVGTAVTTPNRDAFWKTIAQYNATYFCGHEHTYNVAQFADPTNTFTGAPYQVLVGSGGSPFDPKQGSATKSPTDRYYAWATVSVHQSGAVTMDTYGFSDTFGPLQKLSTINVLQ
jgi:hypothetical protein